MCVEHVAACISVEGMCGGGGGMCDEGVICHMCDGGGGRCGAVCDEGLMNHDEGVICVMRV